MTAFRIALCITDLDIGGAEQCLAELATRIDRKRFDPVVYCLADRPMDDNLSCAPKLEAAGVPVHYFGARGVIDSPRTISQLRRALVQQRPQLMQTFLFHANIVGRFAARGKSRPKVVCGVRVAERKKRWHLWMDRLTAPWVDRWVCVSQSVAEFSVKHGRLPSARVLVIPNGIDAKRYPAEPAELASLGLPPGRQAVTFVGRLHEQKGLDWFLGTAPEWLETQPDCDLLLVGQGPERSSLERLCHQVGIASRVHFTGWRKDIPEILAASRLLVLPSRWEGMPNVVLQAMATGIPVLVSDVEGVRELLGDQAVEQTVAFGDTRTLAAKLAGILSHPQTASRLGYQNRTRAELTFGMDRMVADYEALWASLLARCSAK